MRVRRARTHRFAQGSSGGRRQKWIMGVEVWAEPQRERYRNAVTNAWDDFEEEYGLTLKRVGIQSMAATHAANYMRRARMLKDMVDGLIARPTRTDTTPEAIRNAVAELVEFRNGLRRL
jgi:endonuclease V-like protein UPF0215 family